MKNLSKNKIVKLTICRLEGHQLINGTEDNKICLTCMFDPGIRNMARALGNFGVSMQEAAASFNQMGVRSGRAAVLDIAEKAKQIKRET